MRLKLLSIGLLVATCFAASAAPCATASRGARPWHRAGAHEPMARAAVSPRSCSSPNPTTRCDVPMTIHKYTLEVVPEQQVAVPTGARLLSVQAQHNHPRLWALVDTSGPDAPHETRLVHILGTGDSRDVPSDRLVHLGTFQLHGGALVFHAFEERP